MGNGIAEADDADHHRRRGSLLGALFEHFVTLSVGAVVVTTGRDAYRRRDGVVVVPAALLGH